MNLRDNCLTYLKLDEPSGTNAINAVAPLVWTSANCTVNQTGILNKAYSFNGTSSTITPASEPIGTSDSVSISAWVKITTNGGCVFGRGSDSSGNGWSMNATAPVGAPMSLQLVTTSGGPAQYGATGTTNLSTGTWYHVVYVWNAGVHIKVYLNGTNEGTTATATTLLRTSGVGSSFGNSLNPPGAYFDGLIDEAVLWNRALTADEVTTLYNSGAPYAFPFVNDILPAYTVSPFLTRPQ